VNAGTYTVVATPADGNYTGSATGTFTIERAPQYVVFAPLPETPLASIPTNVVLQSSASSNLPVSLRLVSGSVGSLSAEGQLTGIPSVGTVTVQAVQAGNANYLAAFETGLALDVTKKNQYVEFSPIPDLTVTSSAVELRAVSSSGLEPTFSVLSGPATLNGKVITPTGAGTVVVKAVQTGDATYNPAQERLQSFRVLLLAQSLTFPALGTASYGDAPVALRASTDSRLPVSYSVLSGPGIVTDGTLAITAAGEIVVRATQSGNGTYAAAAPLEQVLIVAPRPLRVGVKPVTRSFGVANPVFELTYDGFLAGDGVAGLESLPTVSAGASESSPAGVYGLSLSGGRSSKYRFVFTPGQLTVVKAPQTLAFESLPNQALGNAPFTLGAAASSGLPVAYQLVSGPAAISGNQVALLAAGRAVIRATQPGNGNFEAALPVEQAFDIAEQIQVIAVNSAAKDGYYRAGQSVEITVSFSGIVNVTGTPALRLNSAAQRSATYLSGSGTNVLTFGYQIQAGDSAANLDAAGSGALTGAIASAAGVAAPSLVVPVGSAAGALARARSIIVDTAAPLPPTFNMPLFVGTRRPLLSGQAEPISVVQVFRGGGVVASATADAAGAWSASALADLPEGGNEISARATDVAGNTGALSAIVVLEVDLSVPAAPVIVTSGAFNVVRPVIRGTAAAGSSVTVLRAGSSVGAGVAASDGSWFVDLAADLPVGVNRLTAVARNRAGTASVASVEASVEIDLTPPAAPAFTLSGPVIGARVPITGTAEPLAAVSLFDEKTEIGSARAAVNGQWSITPRVALPAGQRSLSAVARDAAGNAGPASPPLAVTVDPYPPVAPVINAPQFSSSARPQISGRAEAASTVRLYDGNKVVAEVVAAADGAWAFTPGEPWTEGSHPLTAVAIDAAGNISGFSPLSLLIVDSVVPAAPVFTAASFAVTKPAIRGTGEPSAAIRLLRGEQIVGSGAANSAGEWTIVLSVALNEGQNQISAVATDLAGNVSATSSPVAITYNPLVPDAPAFARAAILTNSTAPLIEGTATPGLMVAVKKGDSVLGEVQADNAGRWSLRPGQALPEGLHLLTAFGRSGTTSSSGSAALELRIDLTAPPAPSVQFSTPTRQTKVTFTGAAEARSYVRIYLNNDLLGGTLVPATGQWTFSSARSFAEGSYQVQATAEDEAGNVSPRSAEVGLVIDRTPPSAPSVSSAGLQNSSRPSLAGRSEPLAAIEIYRGAVLIGSGSSAPDGGWTLTVSTSLAEGEHELEVRAVDAAGNRSEPRTAVIRIDTTAPARPVLDPVSPYQNKARPEFSGTAEPGARVVLQEGAVEIGRATAGADGTWRLAAEADLSDGRHSVSAFAIDEAGNRSPATTAVSYDIDTVAPAAPAFSATREYTSAYPAIRGTGEVGVTVQLRLGTLLLGSTVVDEAGQWVVTPSNPLRRGANALTAAARDSAGNPSLTATAAIFTISLSAPAAPVIFASGSSNSRRPEISGWAESGGTVRIFDGGVLLGSALVSSAGEWSFVPTADLNPGARVLSATVTDSGGTVSALSAEVRLEIDVTAPAAPTIDALAATRVPKVVITGNAEARAEVSLFDGAVLLGRVTATAGGRWTLSPAPEFSEGAHPLTAVAKDPAGNTGPASAVVSLVVDFTPPAAPSVNAFVSPTSASRPVLAGRGEAGATIRLLRGVDIVGSSLVSQTGDWTVTPTAALPDGTHTILLVQVDRAGNVGASASRTLVIDTVAPGVPTVFPLNSTSATPVLRGLFDINDTVVLTVTLDGTTYSSLNGEVTLARGNGEWECPVPVRNALRAGTYSAEVVARDAAGNASADLTSGEVLIGPRSATFAPTSPKVRPVSDLALRRRVLSLAPVNVNLAELFVDPAGRDLGFVLREFSFGSGTIAGTVLTARFRDDMPGYATARVLVTPAGGTQDESIVFSVTFVLDTDDDGIADIDEENSGDFNGDGQPDVAQKSVATFKVAKTGSSASDLMSVVVGSFAAADPRGDRNGVVVDSGAVLRSVKSFSVEEFDAKPKDWTALSPVVQFEMANALLKPDGSVELVITVPAGSQAPTKIFKFGYESASAVVKTFYPFDWDGRTGARFIDTNGDGRADIIRIIYRDGERGDDDRLANGIIVDPIVVAGESSTTAAPVIVGLRPSSVVNPPVISGTAVPGATIQVYDGDQLLGSTLANGSGAWAFTPPTALAEGPHIFGASAVLAPSAVSALRLASQEIIPLSAAAPVNSVPAARTVDEDAALAFSGAAAVSVADRDDNLTGTQLTVTNGTLFVNLAGGAVLSAGSNNSAALSLAGSRTQINAALATLIYQGALNFNGSDTLTVVAKDALGATDTDTVAITVTPVNDAPVSLVPEAQTVAEDNALALSGAAAISVADVDGNLVSVRLTVVNGTLAVTVGATGATISAGANTSASLTLAGTAAQLNAALATLVYQGQRDFNGLERLTVVATDSLGATGAGTLLITVTPVTDPPVLSDSSIFGNLVTLRGYAEASVLIKLYVEGALAASVRADAQGSWYLAFSRPPGSYTLQAAATDNLGNASPLTNFARITIPESLRAAQTISFPAPAGVTVGSRTALYATASSGLPVEFAVVRGPGRIENGILVALERGTIVVSASQAGNAAYTSAPDVERSFNVERSPQTIAFEVGSAGTVGASLPLKAVATSGLPVLIELLSGPARIESGLLVLTAAGDVVVRASQPGNANYAPASAVERRVQVAAGAPQTFLAEVVDGKQAGRRGRAAAFVPADGRSATVLLLAPAAGLQGAFTVQLAADGAFTVQVTVAASTPGQVSLRGAVRDGQLTLDFSELGLTAAARALPATGPGASVTGAYRADLLGTLQGSVQAIALPSGQTALLLQSPEGMFGGVLDLRADLTFAGAISGVTDSAEIRGSLSPDSGALKGSFKLPNQVQADFSGLSSALPATGRLINLSSLARSGTGDGTLIAGFTVQGAPERAFLIRGVGPSLAVFGVPGFALNPRLRLYQGTALLAENDDWHAGPAGSGGVRTVSSRVGAFPLAEGSADAALLSVVGSGSYTVHVESGGADGVALAEIYDTGTTNVSSLTNLAVRSTLDAAGGTLTVGFVIDGNAPRRLLVRAIGPGLAQFGVAGVVEDPRLVVRREAAIVAENENWNTAEALGIAAAARLVGAFGLPAGSKDAVLLLTLPPGAYTAQMSDASGGGVGLVEVYQLP